jgi:outer membrane biosynthesis protein TonB
VTIRLSVILTAILLLFSTPGFAQVDSLIAQLSDSPSESFAGGMSGNGRFIVFESTGNLATENPRNADGNLEIFLFDYAQRRIFQITDTKSVLFNTLADATINNVRVSIVNTRPVISNDGKWIAFSSNATTSRPNAPNSTNPGFFYGDSFSSPTPTPTPSPSPTPISLVTPTPTPSPSPTPTPSPTGTPTPTPTPTPAANPLTADGNLEIWLYQIPAYTDVPNLSAGDEIPFTNLAGGSFIRVTNTDPSQLPRPANGLNGAFVADDNHDPSISDDGGVIAFVSTRDLVPSVGNPFPAEDNDEIFTYVRATGTLGQVTKTGRGVISNPIYNKNPTISGNGQRVTFASTAENPIVGMTGGVNPLASRNEEIYFADLVAGSPTVATVKKQVTTTTSTNAGDPVNILDLGRRMSRDGRYIAFDSYADLANENSGTNYTSFALYLYDTNANSFRRIGPRSDADTAAAGGDVAHYPGFTDTDAAGAPATLVLETRLNIKPDGTVPTNSSEGLNDNEVRPSQLYSYPLNVAASTATFKRLAKFPTPSNFIASTQLLPSNSIRRMAFNIALTQFGTDTGNDAQSEVYYLLQPAATTQTTAATNFFTGASRLPILFTASPTPTPTGTPTPTPTVSPTPTPSPSPSPSPSPTASPTGTPTPTPTPVTPAAVLGISPGMLTIMEYTGTDTPIPPKTAVGSIKRVLSLPIELNGVSVAIDGVACGIKSVNGRRIDFVVPRAIGSATTGTVLPIVIHNNGTVLKSWVTIVPVRPDIFPKDGLVGPGGRATAINVTNTIQTTEPFPIKTIRRRGGGLVPSVIRLYMTGIEGLNNTVATIRLRDAAVVGSSIRTTAVLVEPGVYTVDFDLPSQLLRAGDVPVVVIVTVNGTTFESRLDDTATKINIL